MSQFEYQYKDHQIRYELKRTRRKTLGVYIYPDRRVQLRVPQSASQKTIDLYLQKSGGWVVEQLSLLGEGVATPVETYQQGELHYFMGRPYSLVVSAGRPQEVTLSESSCCLNMRTLDPHDVDRNKRLLKHWYKAQASEVFAQRLKACRVKMHKYALPDSSLRFRWMKTRWGSCSSKAVITLNLELLKYSQDIIDYVIVHELCHLREFNHSKKFYAMMDDVMPDWRLRKSSLEMGMR